MMIRSCMVRYSLVLIKLQKHNHLLIPIVMWGTRPLMIELKQLISIKSRPHPLAWFKKRYRKTTPFDLLCCLLVVSSGSSCGAYRRIISAQLREAYNPTISAAQRGFGYARLAYLYIVHLKYFNRAVTLIQQSRISNTLIERSLHSLYAATKKLNKLF